MDINACFKHATEIFSPRHTKLKLYKEQSIYCDLLKNNKKIAISYNFHAQKLFIYHRDKSPLSKEIIKIIEKSTAESLEVKDHFYSIKLENIPIELRLNKYLNLLTITESFVFKEKIKLKNLILGNYLDYLDNTISAPSNLASCNTQFLGKNNNIKIHKNAESKNISIVFLGNNGSVTIGRNVSLTGVIRVGHNCSVIIGNFVTSTNPIYITCAEGTKIDIGDDCMFATSNQIRTDDAHAIYSTKTGKRINHSRNVIIGNHVWIGYRATIFGGTDIGDGSVVGFGSLVNKKFPNNCLIAGTPAKLLKTDIFWQRPNVTYFDQSQGVSVNDFKSLSYCNDTIIEEI